MSQQGDPELNARLNQLKRQGDKALAPTVNDSNPTNDIPLTDTKESLTEANTGVFPEQTPKKHQKLQNDPFHAVNSEIKARDQWVVWKNETRNGKPTKVPYQVNGNKAQANQPNTWTDYQTVINHRKRFSGIGFVFSEADPYCGIDLDNCLDDGSLKDWAKPIVDRLKPVSYAEVSPSGNGIKFWTRATLPAGAKHKAYISEPTAEAIEIYDKSRYFTVTGKGNGMIGAGQQVVDWLISEHLSPEQTPPLPRSVPTSGTLNANEVIAKIQESKQSTKFDELTQGKITRYGSHSEADLALCGVIAFWTQDAAVIDSIFRRSKLMRAKWDERHKSDGTTYGQMTIAEALSGQRETYKPKQYRNINRNSGGYRNVKATWK